ncbi:MAG: hypothetical protein RL685_3001 [Pseudomonadota bacterium]
MHFRTWNDVWTRLLLVGLLAPLGSSCTDETSDDADKDNLAVVADAYAVTSEQRLIAFNRTSGEIRTSVAISGLATAESVIGIDFRPSDSALYALVTGGKLYVVDPASGAATLKSTLTADPTDTTAPFATLDGARFGINFNPVADRLRVVSNSGQNLRINVDTGATTTDGALNPGTPAASAAAYSNSFAAACRTRLYIIDTTTGKLLLQDPPNAGTLSEIGDLGAAAMGGGWASFEVVTSNEGAARALAFLPGNGGSAIYDIDLASGALTASRTLALHSGESLRGASAAPPTVAQTQTPGELVGVTVNDRLVSFNRGAPAKPCTNGALTGLGSGETTAGLDIRPADGKLYALSSAGKIYSVDIPTAAATLVSTMAADPADTSAPFTTLPAGSYGVGFNPVPDRLRVVGPGGINLRINVDTGVTTSDASMAPTSMAVASVGYTNAFAGATSTALYGIDRSSGGLIRIGGAPATGGACPDDTGNPNCGIVTMVGSLGVADIAGIDGFDIDGAPSGANAAYLALRLGAATSSSLYVVDLATGVATPPAGVANPTIGGGEALREFTLTANPTP